MAIISFLPTAVKVRRQQVVCRPALAELGLPDSLWIRFTSGTSYAIAQQGFKAEAGDQTLRAPGIELLRSTVVERCAWPRAVRALFG